MIFAYHNFYSTVEIPKKSGGSRKLQIPSVELKYIQRWILDNILKKIKISNISQDKESWLLAVYITYFVPFVESYFGKDFTVNNWILVFVGIVLLILSQKTVNNPILKILGYKIYSIETEQGVDMTLITKKELRNRSSLSRVVRLFEYYVMEV